VSKTRKKKGNRWGRGLQHAKMKTHPAPNRGAKKVARRKKKERNKSKLPIKNKKKKKDPTLTTISSSAVKGRLKTKPAD